MEEEVKEKKELSPKTKRIINIVVDVVVAIVLAFALLLAICTISSKKKGYDQYTEIFGTAYLAVQSGSMEKDFVTGEKKSDNFAYGDLITIKLLSGSETTNLKVGDVISFRDSKILNGKWVVNTHRIIAVNKENGNVTSYTTHGDNNPTDSNETVLPSEVIGIYKGKAGGIGKVFLFMNTSAGFFVCVVLPTLLIVVYCAVNLILVIKKEKKAQTAEAEQAQLDERERIRQELLAEMQVNSTAPPAAETSPEPAPQPEEVADEKVDAPEENKTDEVKEENEEK